MSRIPNDRSTWTTMLVRIADPVLSNLAAGGLKERMPLEERPEQKELGRAEKFAHLEASSRLLSGIAPWLELGPDTTPEGEIRATYCQLARQSLEMAVTPGSPDYLNFNDGSQALVDTSYLALSLLRAPTELWAKLDATTQQNVIQALKSTRELKPYFNNWVLFGAMIEAALQKFSDEEDPTRLDWPLRLVDSWYKGDGIYGDGPEFSWDYYNSYVIHPFLLEILEVVQEKAYGEFKEYYKWFYAKELVASNRYAEILERLIAPDGTYPPVGRSITYRCGAFQALALKALREELPDTLSLGQIRYALSAVLHNTLTAEDTFDENGWLRIGLAGHQPDLGEFYVNTGSLYMCAQIFLPLGLPENHAFWKSPTEDWTARKIWAGIDLARDEAMSAKRLATHAESLTEPQQPFVPSLRALASFGAFLVLLNVGILVAAITIGDITAQYVQAGLALNAVLIAIAMFHVLVIKNKEPIRAKLKALRYRDIALHR